MGFSDQNWWAILVAIVANQAVGAFWFSPLLFAKPWMKALGLTPEKIRENPTRTPFVVSGLSAVVLAVALSMVVGAMGMKTLGGGIVVGLLAGVGIAVMAATPHYAFSGRNLTLYLIDMGHTVVTVVLMGAIIGVWP